MKVLVTGGAGFIGSHIADLLLASGYHVRILDSLQKPTHLMGKPSYLPEGVEFIEGEVTDESTMKQALEGVRVVFHQAAHQGLLPDFGTFFYVNSVGTARLFELIVKQGYPVEKVIVASSQAVYGEGKYRCRNCTESFYPAPRTLNQLKCQDWVIKCPTCQAEARPLATDETHVNPSTPYAMSKYTQEMIALSLGRQYSIPTVALRYSITQGPRQSFFNAYSGILRIFCTRLMTHRSPILYEDGRMKRDYIHVNDVARANLLVMEREEANYQVYNVGSGVPTTQRQFASALARKIGVEIEPVIPGEFRLGDVRHIVSDVSRLLTLGWRPRKNLDHILADYLSWIRTQGLVKDYFAEAEQIMKATGVVRPARRRNS